MLACLSSSFLSSYLCSSVRHDSPPPSPEAVPLRKTSTATYLHLWRFWCAYRYRWQRGAATFRLRLLSRIRLCPYSAKRKEDHFRNHSLWSCPPWREFFLDVAVDEKAEIPPRLLRQTKKFYEKHFRKNCAFSFCFH